MKNITHYLLVSFILILLSFIMFFYSLFNIWAIRKHDLLLFYEPLFYPYKYISRNPSI